jgi:hypothetical protein
MDSLTKLKSKGRARAQIAQQRKLRVLHQNNSTCTTALVITKILSSTFSKTTVVMAKYNATTTNKSTAKILTRETQAHATIHDTYVHLWRLHASTTNLRTCNQHTARTTR